MDKFVQFCAIDWQFFFLLNVFLTIDNGLINCALFYRLKPMFLFVLGHLAPRGNSRPRSIADS